MLSTVDLERLIAEKRCEIEREKIVLGLSPPQQNFQNTSCKENGRTRHKKQVSIAEGRALSEKNDTNQDKEERDNSQEPEIPADLERYIRRYLGLPVMLRAGEYSPNNPLIRAERSSGDVLLGLGEYERRRNTLRKLRQQQYREYLDQQAKKKQEEKEQAERERREREEKERQREEERERLRQELEERSNSEPRRASYCRGSNAGNSSLGQNIYTNKVDTGVQVGISRALSVAVQTDDADLYRLLPSPLKHQLTQAERELSPRTVVDSRDERPILPAPWARDERTWESTGDRESKSTSFNGDSGAKEASSWEIKGDLSSKEESWDVKEDSKAKEACPWESIDSESREAKSWEIKGDSARKEGSSWEKIGKRNGVENNRGSGDIAKRCEVEPWEIQGDRVERRRSYGDFNERSPALRKSNREKLVSDLRHSYMPSIFDADAIQQRNLQAEKEAAERRQYYQQELKNQILEQQRIREERKNREKMLEKAEMRRLEEQLKMLRVAQEREVGKQHEIIAQTKENKQEFDKRHNALQNEIDSERQKLRSIRTAPRHSPPRNSPKLPFSTNIPDHSIFSPNYDVDSYLRRNLNPNRETLLSSRLDIEKTPKTADNSSTVAIAKALVHDTPKEFGRTKYEPSTLRKELEEASRIDETHIPVLKHTPVHTNDNRKENLSGAMKVVDDKWKVPVVQKNIVRNQAKEGKNVSILTQLGAIRRQLQLEQLKLDSMIGK